MNRDTMRAALLAHLEELASVEHERWSHWQNYMHSKGVIQPDGSLLIPAKYAERWAHQMKTAYSALSEKEKESDREQVRTYVGAIVVALERGPRSHKD